MSAQLSRHNDPEAGLDRVRSTTHPARDTVHFRRIVAAQAELERAQAGLREAVAQTRVAGYSWAVVGAALGISRQAAHKRFVASAGAPGKAPASRA